MTELEFRWGSAGCPMSPQARCDPMPRKVPCVRGRCQPERRQTAALSKNSMCAIFDGVATRYENVAVDGAAPDSAGCQRRRQIWNRCSFIREKNRVELFEISHGGVDPLLLVPNGGLPRRAGLNRFELVRVAVDELILCRGRCSIVERRPIDENPLLVSRLCLR